MSLWENKKNNAYNIRRLDDKSFFLASKQTSVLFGRSSDFKMMLLRGKNMTSFKFMIFKRRNQEFQFRL